MEMHHSVDQQEIMYMVEFLMESFKVTVSHRFHDFRNIVFRIPTFAVYNDYSSASVPLPFWMGNRSAAEL